MIRLKELCLKPRNSILLQMTKMPIKRSKNFTRALSVRKSHLILRNAKTAEKFFVKNVKSISKKQMTQSALHALKILRLSKFQQKWNQEWKILQKHTIAKLISKKFYQILKIKKMRENSNFLTLMSTLGPLVKKADPVMTANKFSKLLKIFIVTSR